MYFNQIARQIAPIRLTGKFGSEVVRTRRLIPSIAFPRYLLHPELGHLVDQALLAKDADRRAHPLSSVVADEIAWYEYGRVAVEQSALVLRTPYMDNRLVKLMYQAETDVRASRELQSNYIIEKSRELAQVPTNLGRVENNSSLLSKAAYLGLWAQFKVEYIYLYATPHWLTALDHKLERLRLERLITGRQKFEGYRIWFRTHFADFIRDVLLSPQAACTNFFEKKWLERAVTSHLAGTHNYFTEINKMLTIELIYSTLLRQTASEDATARAPEATFGSNDMAAIPVPALRSDSPAR